MRKESPQYIRQVLCEFNVEAEKSEVEEISDGHICEVYRVKSARCDHVLRLRPAVFKSRHLSMDHAFLQRLVREGFPAPRVVRSISGDTVGIGPDGRCFELLQYIPHDRTLEGVQYGEVAPDLAGFLGRYHKISADHRKRVDKPSFIGRIPISVQGKYFLGRGQCVVQRYLESSGAELSTVALRLADRLGQLQEIRQLMAEGPQVVAHNDFYGNNVLFCSDEIVGLVDFDFCRTASYAVDLIEGLFAVTVWDPESSDWWGLNPERPPRWQAGAEFLRIYEENSQLQTSAEVLLSMLEAKVISQAFAHGIITRANEPVRLQMLGRAEQIAGRIRQEAGW